MGEAERVFAQLGIRRSSGEKGEPVFRITFTNDYGNEGKEAQYHPPTGTWRIVSGGTTSSKQGIEDEPDSSISPNTLQMFKNPSQVMEGKPNTTKASVTVPKNIWTDHLVPRTKHVELFLATDWASTPLGHLATWSTSLRLMTSMVFTDLRAACLYWSYLFNSASG